MSSVNHVKLNITVMKMAKNISNGDEKDLSKRAASMQIMMSFLASLSVMTSGIGLGYPAITTQLLSRDDAEITLTPSEISWFASIASIASPVGSVLAGFLTDTLGRRNTLMFINIVAFASWLVIGFSSRQNIQLFFVELMIGRALIGATIGMITTPAIMYCSEICHPKLRGRMTVLSTPFFISFGTLVAYLLGFLIPHDFRLVSFISAGITVATFIILFFVPESPVYLITTNKLDKARNALSIIRNIDKNDLKIDDEIDRITKSRKTTNDKQSFLAHWKEFGKPQLYKPFLIMVSFFAIQQFSGAFVLLVYAAQFSIEAGVTMDPFLCSVIIGAIRCLTTVMIAFGSDKFGRKPMAISSGIGMFITMLGITLCAAFSVSESSISWLPTLCIFGFIFAGTLGILTLPFAMVAEMYPQKSRGFASGITMCIAFLLSFINVKFFLEVFEEFGSVAVFSFYTIVALIGILFAIFVLPETKGKTLQEIEEYFIKKQNTVKDVD